MGCINLLWASADQPFVFAFDFTLKFHIKQHETDQYPKAFKKVQSICLDLVSM